MTIASNKTLKVNKKITQMLDPNAGVLVVFFSAESQDGTGYTASASVQITGALNGLTFDDIYGTGYVCYTTAGESEAWYTVLYSEQPVNFEIKSSNPNVLGAWIDYSSVEQEDFWIMRNGRTKWYSGYSYYVYYYTYPNKKGNVTLTVKALDGSNKTAKVKIRVK